MLRTICVSEKPFNQLKVISHEVGKRISPHISVKMPANTILSLYLSLEKAFFSYYYLKGQDQEISFIK